MHNKQPPATSLMSWCEEMGSSLGFSAFGFESMNGHLTGHIHSPYRLAEQLIFSWKMSNCLNNMEDQLMETESEDVLEHLQLNSCSKVGMKLAPRSYVKGHLSNCCLSFIISMKLNFDCKRSQCFFSYNSEMLNDIHSNQGVWKQKHDLTTAIRQAYTCF